MDIQSLLAAILNPNGSQSAAPGVLPNGAGRPQAMPAQPLQAPQAQMPQPMPQSAPQAAPAPGGGGIGDILSNLFAPKQAGRNQTVAYLQSQGLDPGAATILASDKSALRSYLMQRSQGQKPIEIAGKLIDPNTYQVLADFSQPQGRHTTTIEGKLVDTDSGKVIGDYSGQDSGYKLLTPDEIKAAGLPEGVYQKDKEGKIVTVGGVREQDPTFGREKDLRQEYELNPNVKSYQIVRDNYERIRQGAQQTSGAGDLAIIFGYMKMLDPTSVVREGEQASASNAAGVPAAIRNSYNSIMSGDKLSPEARQQLLSAAEQVYGQSAQNLGDLNTRYSGIAQNWQLDPGRIVQMPEKYDPLNPTPEQASTPAPASPSQPAAPRIGETRDGYVYKGGDPSQPSSWVPFPKSSRPPQKGDRAAPDVMRQRLGY